MLVGLWSVRLNSIADNYWYTVFYISPDKNRNGVLHLFLFSRARSCPSYIFALFFLSNKSSTYMSHQYRQPCLPLAVNVTCLVSFPRIAGTERRTRIKTDILQNLVPRLFHTTHLIVFSSEPLLRLLSTNYLVSSSVLHNSGAQHDKEQIYSKLSWRSTLFYKIGSIKGRCGGPQKKGNDECSPPWLFTAARSAATRIRFWSRFFACVRS